MALIVAVAACDKDPTRVVQDFSLSACPAGPIGVNSPLILEFTNPIGAGTVVPGNIVVTFAETGLETPGTLSLDASGRFVTFTPSDPLPFGTELRVRVQNLLSDPGNTPIGVTVCEFTTEPPPITELFWRALPPASGTRLSGISFIDEDSGFVSSTGNPLFVWDGDTWEVAYSNPYFDIAYDVSFVDALRGFVSYNDARLGGTMVLETRNGGITFDTLQKVAGNTVNRLFFRRTGAAENALFGVAGGGTSSDALLLKYNPATGLLESRFSMGGTASIGDIDFQENNLNGVAVSTGIKIGQFLSLGRVFVTSDGGQSWTDVPGAAANDRAVTYHGTAIRDNGEIYVTGGSGYVLRLSPGTGGAYTVTRILENRVTNPDSLDPNALLYLDVQFAPDNDLKGWIVGAQQVGLEEGVPRYQGVIFETRDGGQTWVRQGVADAPNYGAEFPRLDRLSVLSATSVWIAGDAGVVLEYRP